MHESILNGNCHAQAGAFCPADMADRLRSCSSLTAGMALLDRNAVGEASQARQDLQARIAVSYLNFTCGQLPTLNPELAHQLRFPFSPGGQTENREAPCSS